MRHSVLWITPVAILFTSCTLSSAPDCIVGDEQCIPNVYLTSEGIYQVCRPDGKWGNEFACGAGCSVDKKRCVSNIPAPQCIDNEKFKCIEQHNIAISFQCRHEHWIPEICLSGKCNEEFGCISENSSCSEADSNCFDVPNMQSFQATCTDGHWILAYCPKGVTCDGKKCSDSSTQKCGDPQVNCKETVPGWQSGKCTGGQCAISECIKSYHLNDQDPDHVFCEINSKDNCGAPGKTCNDDGCQLDKGVCGCDDGWQPCDGICVDTQSDTNHCGKCNNHCDVDNSAETLCQSGSCILNSCDKGYHILEDKECEKNDNDNCGSHGVTCTTNMIPGSTSVSCDSGLCVATACDSEHTLNGASCMLKTCTNGEIICNNFDTTGKRFQCNDNTWNEIDTCPDNKSCNSTETDCGDCINTQTKCENSSNIGTTSICTKGAWMVDKTCNTSCAGNTCGNCKDGETKCENVKGVGNIFKCEKGKWQVIDNCGVNQCNGNTCAKPCEGSSNYTTVTFPESKTVSAYCIKSEDDLRSIRDAVKAGNPYPSDNKDNAYVLTKDLTLTDTSWFPIGSRDNPFKGYFYGNDKLIKFTNPIIFNTGKDENGMYIWFNGHGLFGHIKDSVIMNMSVDMAVKIDPEFYSTSDIGALAGSGFTNSTISNVHAKLKVFPEKDYLYSEDKSNFGGGSIGGLAASAHTSTITNCDADVDFAVFGDSIGGLLGISDCSTVINSHSTGSIYASGRFGGFIGNIQHWDCREGYNEISNCSSDVYLSYIADKYTTIPNYSGCTGGFAGIVSYAKLHDNYSASTIDSNLIYYAGGLIGCLNNDNEVTNSFHIGTIKARRYVGGVIGLLNGHTSPGSSVSNTFHLGLVTGNYDPSISISGYLGGHNVRISDNLYNISNSYTIYTNNLSPSNGFIGVIYDQISNSVTEFVTTLKTLTITNSYYSSNADLPYSDGAENGLVGADLKTLDLVKESGKYVAKTGNKPLKDALGSGWKNYTCSVDMGDGKKDYVIPIPTSNVPAFCHK